MSWSGCAQNIMQELMVPAPNKWTRRLSIYPEWIRMTRSKLELMCIAPNKLDRKHPKIYSVSIKSKPVKPKLDYCLSLCSTTCGLYIIHYMEVIAKGTQIRWKPIKDNVVFVDKKRASVASMIINHRNSWNSINEEQDKALKRPQRATRKK